MYVSEGLLHTQRSGWSPSELEALDAVTKAGVEIIRPDKTQFMQKTQSLLDDYKDDQEMYSLIQQIQSVK